MISVIEVNSEKLFQQFVDLPYDLHRNDPSWLPPIYSDDKVFFDRSKNGLFKSTDAILLLAFHGKRPVGRVLALIPRDYNKRHQLKDIRFNYFECIDDYAVAEALLDYVKNWGKEKGCMQLVGLLGFSDKEPQGLEIEGGNNPPLILSNVNFPYVKMFFEKYGLTKSRDLISFGIRVPESYPEVYFKTYSEYKSFHQHLTILAPKNRWTVWRYLRPAMNLINELFTEIYAHNPLNKRDIDALVRRFALLLIPEFMKGVLNEKGELVAFVIGIPNVSEGIQACQGKLFPFGFLKVLRALKTSKEVILMIGGIKKEYRNIGLDYWLSLEMYNSLKRRRIEMVKSHLILEDNVKTHAKMLKFGGFINKRFRIYSKSVC